MGAVLGWTAPALDSMRSNESVPQLLGSDEDKIAKSWIGSSLALGALVGALISGNMVCLYRTHLRCRPSPQDRWPKCLAEKELSSHTDCHSLWDGLCCHFLKPPIYSSGVAW